MSRTRSLLASLLIAGVAAVPPTIASAQCVPAAFPPNWLQAQEVAGGHTIARHVNQPIQNLINRVLNGVAAAGSYPSVPVAEAAIINALTANAVILNNWRAAGGFGGGPVNVGATTAFNATRPANIGVVAYGVGNPPNAVSTSQTCAFRVVMRAQGGNTCRLLTSYPRPATPGDHCP